MVNPVPGPDTNGTKERLQREALARRARKDGAEICSTGNHRIGTALIILEDLHWVDHSTVIFSAIARRREPAKLFVLGIFRPADLILYDTLSNLKTDPYSIILARRFHSNVSLSRTLPNTWLQSSQTLSYLRTLLPSFTVIPMAILCL